MPRYDEERHMRSRANGRKEAQRRDIPFTCVVCGTKAMTIRAWKGRAKYCSKECSVLGQYQNKRDSVYRCEHASCGKVGGPWLVVADPDESWGCNSTLTMNEARDLLQRGYLAIGLTLKHDRLGSEYRVEKGLRGLKLEKIA